MEEATDQVVPRLSPFSKQADSSVRRVSAKCRPVSHCAGNAGART
jgi:hypothetical protein